MILKINQPHQFTFSKTIIMGLRMVSIGIKAKVHFSIRGFNSLQVHHLFFNIKKRKMKIPEHMLPAIYDLLCDAFCTEEKCPYVNNGGCTMDVWYNYTDQEITNANARQDIKKEIEGEFHYDCHKIWNYNSVTFKSFVRRHCAKLLEFEKEYRENQPTGYVVDENDPYLIKCKEILERVKAYVIENL